MPMTPLIASLEQISTPHTIGRVGGNIPAVLDGQSQLLADYNFYASFQHPYDETLYITVLTPKAYDRMIDGNVYPNCSVKVVCHELSEESTINLHTNDSLNAWAIFGYQATAEHAHDFITVAEHPALLQDEDYYYQALENDHYRFFMSLDEDHYPDGLISGDYVFGYGKLFLYEHASTGEIIAGFWQFS